jgi:ferredoxin-type protein NapG
MNRCPSGALIPVPLLDIDMGTAVWREQSCLRTTRDQNGSTQDCTICVDHCPLGSAAIELQRNRVVVKPLSCIGCGVCQQDCPTSPKSITVIPKSARER